MKKFAADIERDMAFLLSRDLKKSLHSNDAVAHLSKARNLLENAGHIKASKKVADIIKKAQSIDDSEIEVKA